MSYTTQIIDTATGAPLEGGLFTPYQCAKVVNEELANQGYEIVLPPQMFYNYIKQGSKSLPTVTVEIDGKTQKRVREVDLAVWLQGYLERKSATAAKLMKAVTKKA